MSAAAPPRRIGLYSPLDPNFVGGMHTWLREFWEPFLRTRDAELRVIHMGLQPGGGKTDAQTFSQRVHVRELDGMRMPGTGAKIPRVSELERAFEGLDVLYLDNGYFLQDRVALRAAQSARLPVVSGHHSVIVGEGFHRLAWLASGRWLLPRYDAVHALNDADADYLRSLGAKNVMTIPIAIDVVRFHPAPRPERDAFVVGFLGRLHPQKGIDRLVEFARAAKRVHGKDLEFRIAGDGPLRREVTGLVEEGVATYVGHVSAESTPSFLRECDVLCMPSRNETFGIVAAEAAACGRRVIASDLPHLRSVLSPEWNEFVSEPDDRHAWTAAIERSMTEEDRWREIGDDAAHRFGFEAVAQEFDVLLEAAVRGAHN